MIPDEAEFIGALRKVIAVFDALGIRYVVWRTDFGRIHESPPSTIQKKNGRGPVIRALHRRMLSVDLATREEIGHDEDSPGVYQIARAARD